MDFRLINIHSQLNKQRESRSRMRRTQSKRIAVHVDLLLSPLAFSFCWFEVLQQVRGLASAALEHGVIVHTASVSV